MKLLATVTTPIPATYWKRPLLHPATFQAACGLNEDEVQAAIEDGKIEWAFDLRSEEALRGCPRIFAGSLESYQAKEAGQAGRSYQIEEVLQAILPPGNSMVVMAAELARRCGIGSDHIHALIDARSFKVLVPARTERGRNSSPGLCRKSVATWLEERRMA